jgi:multicomponent Na+:H+ antiporter subunit G
MIWVVVAGTFLALGVFLLAIATVGILRLPDFFTRVHTIGKADTMGIVLILVGVAVAEGVTQTTLKLVFVIIFYLLSNPSAAHAMAHAALRSGLVPWTRPKGDRP